MTDHAHDTTGRTRAFLEDWFRRLTDTGFDGQVFLGALADDVVWTATGHSPVSGTFRGKQEYADGVSRPGRGRAFSASAMSTEVAPG